jgi:hypothetical protein
VAAAGLTAAGGSPFRARRSGSPWVLALRGLGGLPRYENMIGIALKITTIGFTFWRFFTLPRRLRFERSWTLSDGQFGEGRAPRLCLTDRHRPYAFARRASACRLPPLQRSRAAFAPPFSEFPLARARGREGAMRLMAAVHKHSALKSGFSCVPRLWRLSRSGRWALPSDRHLSSVIHSTLLCSSSLSVLHV